MNDKIAKGMIDKMVVTSTEPTYTSLKSKEEELLAQLKDLREEIAKAEKGIVVEKLNTAIQCLVDIDNMTNGYHNLTVEKYCCGCDDYVDIDFELDDIISVLQQMR